MICVRFGLITEDTDVSELVSLVFSTGREVEESSKVRTIVLESSIVPICLLFSDQNEVSLPFHMLIRWKGLNKTRIVLKFSEDHLRGCSKFLQQHSSTAILFEKAV